MSWSSSRSGALTQFALDAAPVCRQAPAFSSGTDIDPRLSETVASRLARPHQLPKLAGRRLLDQQWPREPLRREAGPAELSLWGLSDHDPANGIHPLAPQGADSSHFVLSRDSRRLLP